MTKAGIGAYLGVTFVEVENEDGTFSWVESVNTNEAIGGQE